MRSITTYIMLLLLISCQSSTVRSQQDTQAGSDIKPATEPLTDARLDRYRVGVKVFRNIHRSMSNATGVALKKCESDYNVRKGLLPQSTFLSLLGNVNLNAVLDLSECHCKQLMLDSNLRSIALPQVDFSATSSVAFSTREKMETTAKTILLLALSHPVEELSNAGEVVKALADLGDNIKSTEPNNAVATLRITRAMCTAAFSSFNAIAM